MPGTTRRAAFFDVDETVIKVKSMFDFLRHWHERAGSGADAYETAVARLHAIADAGRPRSEVNRAYYRGFAGVPHADLMAEGRAWYARYRNGTADTADFVALAERVSGRDLDAFFRTWLYEPGKPTSW